MSSTDNQKVKSNRERLKERYSSRYPDKNWDAEGGEDELDGLVADELDGFDKENQKRKVVDDRMNAMFKSDSRFADLFLDAHSGKDPMESFVERYGSDMASELGTPEGKEKFKEANEKWKKQNLAKEESDKQFNANLDKSAKVMVQFADENNLSDEEVGEIVKGIYDMANDAFNGIFTMESLTAAYKASKYDNDVAGAKAQGEIAGRNAKIRSQLRTSAPSSNVPPTLSSMGSVENEFPKEKPKEGKLDMFGGIPVRRKN